MAIKEKAKETATDIKTIWKNFTALVDAVSLLTVSSVAFWAGYTHDFTVDYYSYLVTAASLIIGLKGAHEFIKTLKK